MSFAGEPDAGYSTPSAAEEERHPRGFLAFNALDFLPDPWPTEQLRNNLIMSSHL